MPDPETWRWLIGGGLGALTVGVGWLLRMVWQASATLQRIEDRLGFHGTLHDQHAETAGELERRLREVAAKVDRHSGQLEAL